MLAGSLAVALSSCAGSNDRTLSKVFVAPPWTGDEHNEYNLIDEGGDLYGTCVLETDVETEPGKTRLSRLCANEPRYRDDGTVLVDSLTLVPLEAARVRTDAEKNERVAALSVYEPPIVKFIFDDKGKVRETERKLPEPTETSPDPGYYDDESLLWLVRGMDLREGYEASFQNVNAGTGQTFPVDLKVEGRETIQVPAGEFTAWKIRVRTASVTQFVWVEAEGSRRLVKARIEGIEDVIYELTASN
ncbi:MAG: DUF3108 domain-containing protein [Chloroflexi bacterium]|nr:DUF3108 domain-containing protein [Chloroflexota bacterium]PWB42652.1 MAG: hypothetical protein C3F10_12960 [Dehalococcoidia bacterium]